MQQLSEPPRAPPRNPAALAPLVAAPDPLPRVSFGWFEPLPEPIVKTLPGLKPGEQQFIVWQPAPSPFVATGWFTPLNEPVRFLPGLKPGEQQDLAAPTQLRPTPTSFVILNATETRDSFLGALMEWARVTSGEVGVIVNFTPTAEIGAGIVPITSAQVAIFTQ
jgi:hypothetical protein